MARVVCVCLPRPTSGSDATTRVVGRLEAATLDGLRAYARSLSEAGGRAVASRDVPIEAGALVNGALFGRPGRRLTPIAVRHDNQRPSWASVGGMVGLLLIGALTYIGC